MPRKPNPVPTYHKHVKGQGFSRYRGKTYWFGKYGTDESRRRYKRFLEQIEVAEDVADSAPLTAVDSLTVAELACAYLQFAQRYYVNKHGEPTKEQVGVTAAVDMADAAFGVELACKVGPRIFTAFQERLIDDGHSRSYINKVVGRVKRMFKWACQQEILPGEVYHRLACVTGLRFGRTRAPEAEEVTPVPDDVVQATLPWLSPIVRAMVQVQRLTGMRPSETCIMRPCDIDRGGVIWLYRPTQHKNAWRDIERIVPIPIAAQGVLQPFLDRNHEAYLFSPRDAERYRREHSPATTKPNRKTKIYPSELLARAKKKAARKDTGYDRLNEFYTCDSYRQAIGYGVEKAERHGVSIPKWFPYQLRHSIGTEVARLFGQQCSQYWLGHEHLETTGIYAEKQVAEIVEIATRLDRQWSANPPAILAEQSPPATASPA